MYIIAHKLQDIYTQNLTADTTLSMYRASIDDCFHFPVAAVNVIYEGTGGDCSARRLLADIYVDVEFRAPESGLKVNGNILTKEFALDAVASMKAMSRGSYEDLLLCRDPAVYHEGEGRKMPGARDD